MSSAVQDQQATQATQLTAGPQMTETGSGPAGDDLCQFVICRIGQEEFAVDVLSVQEINRLVEVTRVPKTPRYVEGVINLRGRIIPVLDLRRRFGLTASAQTMQSRIVVVSVPHGDLDDTNRSCRDGKSLIALRGFRAFLL